MNFNNLDSRSPGFRSPTGKSSAFPRLAMLVVLGLFSHSAFAMLCKNGGNPISGISHPSTYTTPVTDFDLYGTGTNQIKVHISKNDKVTPCIGIEVHAGEAPELDLGAGFGRRAICKATDSNGDCYFNVRSKVPGRIKYLTNAVNTYGGNEFAGYVTFTNIAARATRLTAPVNNQAPDGIAADILQADIRSNLETPLRNVNVVFAGVGSCTTDASGVCRLSKTSTTAGTFSSSVTANGIYVGDLVYSFRSPAVPSPALSVVDVTRDGQAVGPGTPDILRATIRDTNSVAYANAIVTFAATPGIQFNGGVSGQQAQCTTDAGGSCTVTAAASRAGSYSTPVSLGSSLIATPNYNFVAGAASAAHSGARVVTDNVYGDGTTPAVIEVLLRDAFDNPVAAGVTASFSSPDSDIAFSGAAAGSCATVGSTGICRANVTSSQAAGATRNIAVTTGGAALTGSFTAASLAYGKSPVVLTFSPWVARLQIVKQLSGGSATAVHVFRYAIDGMQAASDTIRLTGNGSASGAVLLGLMPAGAITLTETASPEWPDAPVSASCVDLASATPTVPFGTRLGAQLLIPASHAGSGANLRCTFASVRGEFLAGRIFSDTGVGGTANDGIPNGAEPGLPGVPVTLTNCSGTGAPYASDRSDGAGQYRLAVPPTLAAGSRLCVEMPEMSSRRPTGASVGNVALSPTMPTTIAGTAFTYRRSAASTQIELPWPGPGAAPLHALNFAGVPMGSFVQDGLRHGRPGSTVQYPHVFTAGSSGTLSFSVAQPAPEGWIQQVFADPGCVGQKPANAALLYPPAATQTVAAGQAVCIVLQDTIPAQAPTGSHHDTILRADFTFTNASPALSASYQVHDVTSVSNEALSLVKEVRNITQKAIDFGVANQAKPGDVLEYRIRYSNPTPTPITALAIKDITPAYTSFVSATADTLPTGLSACRKTTPANDTPVPCSEADKADGRRGTLQWLFDGTLTPGATGTVFYQVKVD